MLSLRREISDLQKQIRGVIRETKVIQRQSDARRPAQRSEAPDSAQQQLLQEIEFVEQSDKVSFGFKHLHLFSARPDIFYIWDLPASLTGTQTVVSSADCHTAGRG